MKKCEQCNYKFKLKDTLKPFSDRIIECPECNSAYRMEVRFICSALIIAIGVQIYLSVVSKVSIFNLSIYLLASFIISNLFENIPYKLHNYKKIDEQENK